MKKEDWLIELELEEGAFRMGKKLLHPPGSAPAVIAFALLLH
jgi:hypothetical protein